MSEHTHAVSPYSDTDARRPGETPLALSADSAAPKCFREIESHSVKHLESPSAKKVLDSIRAELHSELTYVLDKCGFYYRLSSRVKSAASLTKKLAAADDSGCFKYHAGHLLQDLFGFRILIYFIEDMPILQNLLRRHFIPEGEWTKVSFQPQEFNAVSINGVFRLSDALREKLSSLISGKCIDATFEIQLRTVSFDGWHEIEHDYGYKFNNMWQNQGDYLRRFHSVLASLELCDDTMVTTLENLAYDIYSRRRHPARYENAPDNFGQILLHDSKRSTLCDWDRMIRAHFRLRFNHVESSAWPDQELFKSLSNLFESEALTEKRDAYRFAKYVLRFRKETLVNLLYDPKGTLNETRANTEYISPDNIHRIWDSYDFRKRISVDVNSVVVLILLYKEAREASLSDTQRELLATDRIRQLVAERTSGDSIVSIIQEKSTLLSLPENHALSEGFNTVHKNDLMLTTGYSETEWRYQFACLILSDIKTLLGGRCILPEQETILSALDRTGSYDSGNLPSDLHKFFRFSIRYEHGSILYAISYPGLYMEENYWRQIAEFSPVPSSMIFDRAGIPVRMKLCIQYCYRKASGSVYLPEITEPNLLQEIRAYTGNHTYAVKPYIGQKKDIKHSNRHYMDITYIRKRTDAEDGTCFLSISRYFLNWIFEKHNIHPIVLFLFDSMEDFMRMETKLAIFENSLGNIAYVYAGIIVDENSPVFDRYYKKDGQPEEFISLSRMNITGSGVYVFRQAVEEPDTENPCAFIKCVIARSMEEIERFEYTPVSRAGQGKAETHRGLYALTEALRHELRKYNLLIKSGELEELSEKFDTI